MLGLNDHSTQDFGFFGSLLSIVGFFIVIPIVILLLPVVIFVAIRKALKGGKS